MHTSKHMTSNVYLFTFTVWQKSITCLFHFKLLIDDCTPNILSQNWLKYFARPPALFDRSFIYYTLFYNSNQRFHCRTVAKANCKLNENYWMELFSLFFIFHFKQFQASFENLWKDIWKLFSLKKIGVHLPLPVFTATDSLIHIANHTITVTATSSSCINFEALIAVAALLALILNIR